MIAMGVMLAALAAGPADGPEPKSLFRPEMFETLVNPACSHCVDEARRKAGALRDDDRVLAWIRGKYDGGAIPYRWFLVPYRVISDTYGVFVYDADADFVRGYPASLDYRFHGWRNGVMVMRHKDGTLFDCLTGLAFDGPRKGEQLTPIPTIETDWGTMARRPNPVRSPMRWSRSSSPNRCRSSLLPESRKTRPEPDPRLDAEERVFRPDTEWRKPGLAAEVVRPSGPSCGRRSLAGQAGRHPLGRPNPYRGGLCTRDGRTKRGAGDARRGH